MPFFPFGDKFSPKKTPPRRAHSLSNLNLDADKSRQEFGVDVGPVKLKLGGQEVAFENGMWVQESGPSAASHKEVMRLRKENQNISEENNLLKLKIDILLDMVSRITAYAVQANNVYLEKRDLIEALSSGSALFAIGTNLAETSAISHYHENELKQLKGGRKR